MNGDVFYQLEEQARMVRDVAAGGLDVWSAIAFELLMVTRGKQCADCTDKRILSAVHHFVGGTDHLGSAEATMAIVRDKKQNLCDKCTSK